jgi:threonine dehydratase
MLARRPDACSRARAERHPAQVPHAGGLFAIARVREATWSMQPPGLHAIRAARARIDPFVVTTPILAWNAPRFAAASGVEDIVLKLEFLQRTGSFKVRGALNNLLTFGEAQRAAGAITVSAGNHAIALAYACALTGVSVTVVMPRSANPARVAKATRYGAAVVLVDGVSAAFETAERIRRDEGRTFVHPFEGLVTVTGQATVGLELAEQVRGLDAVVVAVGGGGLIAGVGSALEALAPGCRVIGVEPTGAAGLTRSLARGAPEPRVEVDTIADSMGAPRHEPVSFAICQQVVDQMVLVDDDMLRAGVAWAFEELKLALEPAGAAALAALTGPLAGQLRGQRVAAVLCGSNIDAVTYVEHLTRGLASLPEGGPLQASA